MSDQTRTKATLFPDLSKASAMDEAGQKVLLNGMTILFDEKVGLYPVRLEKKEDASREGERGP